MHCPTTNTTDRTPCATSSVQFPERLHNLMTFVEEKGLEHIISWVENGHAIQVYKPDRLVDEILPLYFRQSKYRSFRRQLNMWSFERILCGTNRGAFRHPYFIKGRKDLCQHQTRQTFKRSMPTNSQLLDMAAPSSASTSPTSFSKLSPSSPSAMKRKAEPCWGKEAPMTMTAQRTPSLLSMLDHSGLSMKFENVMEDNDFEEDVTKMMSIMEPTPLLEESTLGRLEDGDIVPFEGRHFHFLDTGSP